MSPDASPAPSPRLRRQALCASISLAAILSMSAFVGAGCGTPSGMASQFGTTQYTLVNMRSSRNRLNAVNVQNPDLILVCTAVQFVDMNRKRLKFKAVKTGQIYLYDYHKSAMEPFARHLKRLFGPSCPSGELAALSPLDRAGVEAGKAWTGMTKQGVILAIGYPPRHRTPSLDGNDWLYWGSRGRKFRLFFESGRVKNGKGIKAAELQPPAHLGAGALAARPPSGGSRQAPAAVSPGTAAALDGPLYSRRVAVVVGINDYTAWPDLSGARGDAQRMAKYLRSEGFDEVIEVYDRDATRRRVLKVLGTELPAAADENALAVIYFAGHGQTETLPGGGKRGYLIPSDAETHDVFSTAISMDTVRDLSKRTPAKHVYYAIDACYSGLALTRGITVRKQGMQHNTYLRKITSTPAVQVITAGSEGEQAVEIGGQGLFTTYLLRALSGEADYDGDGAVTATEIGAFVKPQVTTASGNRQTPQFGTMEGSGEVVFLIRH